LHVFSCSTSCNSLFMPSVKFSFFYTVVVH
jgi:hypothetical protein